MPAGAAPSRPTLSVALSARSATRPASAQRGAPGALFHPHPHPHPQIQIPSPIRIRSWGWAWGALRAWDRSWGRRARNAPASRGRRGHAAVPPGLRGVPEATRQAEGRPGLPGARGTPSRRSVWAGGRNLRRVRWRASEAPSLQQHRRVEDPGARALPGRAPMGGEARAAEDGRAGA